MGKLFEYANEYVKRSDWKDLALVKFCLFSMGILAGMKIAPKYRKTVAWIGAAIFLTTYVPLMAKFFKIVSDGRKENRQQYDRADDQ